MFGVNNRGPNFADGVYVGNQDTFDDYMKEITNELVTEFDARIVEIEKKVNLVFSMKWIVLSDKGSPEQSCLGSGPFATTCEETTLGDFALPICEICDTRGEIDKWYKLVVNSTGTHVDPRIDGENFCWARLGNRLVFFFEQLKKPLVLQSTDWRKLAHLVRAHLMYILSLNMTEKVIKKIEPTHYENLEVVKELMKRNRIESSKNVTCYDCIDNLIEDLMKYLSENDYIFDNENFFKMTIVEGLPFRRNEMEDDRFFGHDYEKDDYICFNYAKRTRDIGEAHGRMLAVRKRILFNPLCSSLVENFVFDVPDVDYQRVRMMGLAIGQTMNLPTRNLKNERRKHLWEELEYWPNCSEAEGTGVNHTEVRFKCTTPTPMHEISKADAVTQLSDMRSPIELL